MQSASPPSASTDAPQTASHHGNGRTGTLENPEVLENVPGHVIPILEREPEPVDTENT